MARLASVVRSRRAELIKREIHFESIILKKWEICSYLNNVVLLAVASPSRFNAD